MAEGACGAVQWVGVARLDELPPNSVRAVWAGTRAVALVNLAGSLYALDGVCPHRQGPLGEGRLVGEQLTCPWHGFRFDPRSGEPTMPATPPPVAAFAVRVVGDEIQVGLPAAD
jgi:nitrite reductase/ring-hydroxylating ferredoxin subunit